VFGGEIHAGTISWQSAARYCLSDGNSWKPSIASGEWVGDVGEPSSFRSSECPHVHLNLLHWAILPGTVFIRFISVPQTGHTKETIAALIVEVERTWRAKCGFVRVQRINEQGCGKWVFEKRISLSHG